MVTTALSSIEHRFMQRLDSPSSLPSARGPAADWIAPVVPTLLLVLAAGWWVFGFMAGRIGKLIPSLDIYAAFYQNMDYALRSLRNGHGLLWNSLQNCGQPFLPATLLGPFYPMNLVFLIFDLDRGLMVAAFLHLVLAGVGTYLLCREVDLGRTAALCAAISFELGKVIVDFAGWLPVTILGAFVWLPWALLWCERTLRAPTLRAGAWLGIVLTLSLSVPIPSRPSSSTSSCCSASPGSSSRVVRGRCDRPPHRSRSASCSPACSGPSTSSQPLASRCGRSAAGA